MFRVLAYLWAAPTTLLGLAAGLLGLMTGGGGRYRGGTLEFWGGLVTLLLRSPLLRAGALTLGHVILGRSVRELDRCRDHELVHVRQTERWGPFFLPAYVASSLWAILTGRHYYLGNRFEIEAYRRTRRTWWW